MKFLVIVATAVLVGQAAAKPTFLQLIPGSKNVKGVDAIGHKDPSGGGARNAFGSAFDKAGQSWTVDLCYADSDEDGQFNGAELGDPCCEWVKGTNEKLAYATASNPGDKASTSDEKLWASVKCSNGKDPLTNYKAHMAGGAGAGSGVNSTSGASSTPVTTPKPSAAVQTALAGSVILIATAAILL